MQIIPGMSTLVTFVLLAGCSLHQNTHEETQILLNTDREFAQMSLEQGTANAFRAFLADSAMELLATGEPTIGRENIFSEMAKDSSGSILSWVPKQAEIAQSGELGYTWGTYRLLQKDKATVLGIGKYLNIWKKQADGTWKVAVDIGNYARMR